MNKENKKLAQERRAAERKKKARQEMIRKVVVAVLVVAVIGGIIIYGVWDSKNNTSGDTTADTTEQDTTAGTDDTEADTDDTGDDSTESSLNTDTSLVVADGDLVNIDYVGTVDGIAFDGGTGNYDLEIGSGSFIDDFEDQLIGHNVGETVEVKATFPESYSASATYTDAEGESHPLAGVEATFEVTINGIYQ
jgi:trigger factor